MTGPMSPHATLKVVDHGRNRKNIAHAMLVNVCPYCGQTHESSVFTVKKWNAWLEARKRGAHVQGFWPEFSPAERKEFFISGMCGACWRKMEEAIAAEDDDEDAFAEDDDEDAFAEDEDEDEEDDP